MNHPSPPAGATTDAAAGRILRYPGEGPAHHLLVLRLDGQDVAQFSAWNRKGLVHIEHVHTMPSHRRHGHAGRVLAALFARRRGRAFALCPTAFEFPDVTAEHPPPDTATLTAWYTRLGFRPATDGRLIRPAEQAKRLNTAIRFAP
ncbi:GNAT family N-acetyltransferase [Lentzea terrae]|uniref:GNAT family N-acetyltransferase n=1 Tax=Lentzea terrae TaxID=2200761 RepID=UPI000DD2FA95|nr:GNAT family N-acetyltransferase [Lentzea terrae]